MHDGRFATLEQVIDHYDSGVKDGPALDRRLKGPDGRPLVLNLAQEDKAALVAFLKTLSDPVLAANPVFSNPFRQ
jgi:cytochrome c peroxidase